MKDEFLNEAINIGDRLLKSAKRDKHGIFWETPSTYNNVITWSSGESIYGGNSGIVLFLIALYSETKNEKYLLTAEEAMNWVYFYCKNNPSSNYSFFSGRIGVSYTFIKLAEITKNKLYIKKALTIAKKALLFLNEPFQINDIASGISGTLLGLLFLYESTQEIWVFNYIQKYINVLLSNAHFGKYGLFWDREETQIRPLCGFAHGSGGIGFVFLEVAHYFKNPAFIYVAEQAFAYENYYFDKEINNWPDFRVHMDTPEEEIILEDLFKKGELEKFILPIDKNQWCHGAAGIGLSRLRFQELVDDKKYIKDIQYTYSKTINTTYKSFTLCHGEGGSAEFFIQKYLLSRHYDDLEPAIKIAKRIINSKKINNKYSSGLHYSAVKYPEDSSLLNGTAGIGYFLLRISKPEKIDSVLAPRIDSVDSERKQLNILPFYITKKKLFSNMFPKTIKYIEKIQPQKLHEFFLLQKINKSEIRTFINFINKLAASLKEDKKQILMGYFNLEVKKNELQQQNENNAIIYIKNKINIKKARELNRLSDDILLTYKLILTSEIKLISSKTTQSNFILYKLTPYEVEEVKINQFCYIVLNSFKKKSSVKSVIKNIYQNYKKKAKEDLVSKEAIKQIRQAINYGILLEFPA